MLINTHLSFFQLHGTQFNIHTQNGFREIALDFLNGIACSTKMHSKFLIANKTENICVDYRCSQHHKWYLQFGLMWINFHRISRLIYDIHKKKNDTHVALDIEAIPLGKWALLNV